MSRVEPGAGAVRVYKPVTIVEVRAWNQLVGAVARDPRLGYYAFEYAPAFLKTGIELAPLSMPLKDARNPFVFTDLPEATYKRLPPLLADALRAGLRTLAVEVRRHRP